VTDILLLLMLVICALAAVHMKDLLGAGIILSAYSLLMAVVWTRLNAVDVAFTEAAVGAGITTVLLIAAISRTVRGESLGPMVRHARPALFVILVTGAVLVYGSLDMPDFADPEAPANKHVAPRYIVVTENIIRRIIARLMIPFIQLYGLYVIVHGDSGPGGGFQGGVILGSSIILYAIVFGLEEARGRISQKLSDMLTSTGVLIYAGVGLVCLLVGGRYLQYNVLPFGDPHLASHYGIFFIEVGVGITVAAVMITIFFETAKRDGKQGAKDD
jgi:multicomponent Na+:H+ antiporter subunit B